MLLFLALIFLNSFSSALNYHNGIPGADDPAASMYSTPARPPPPTGTNYHWPKVPWEATNSTPPASLCNKQRGTGSYSLGIAVRKERPDRPWVEDDAAAVELSVWDGACTVLLESGHFLTTGYKAYDNYVRWDLNEKTSLIISLDIMPTYQAADFCPNGYMCTEQPSYWNCGKDNKHSCSLRVGNFSIKTAVFGSLGNERSQYSAVWVGAKQSDGNACNCMSNTTPDDMKQSGLTQDYVYGCACQLSTDMSGPIVGEASIGCREQWRLGYCPPDPGAFAFDPANYMRTPHQRKNTLTHSDVFITYSTMASPAASSSSLAAASASLFPIANLTQGDGWNASHFGNLGSGSDSHSNPIVNTDITSSPLESSTLSTTIISSSPMQPSALASSSTGSMLQPVNPVSSASSKIISATSTASVPTPPASTSTSEPAPPSTASSKPVDPPPTTSTKPAPPPTTSSKAADPPPPTTSTAPNPPATTKANDPPPATTKPAAPPVPTTKAAGGDGGGGGGGHRPGSPGS